MAKARRAPTFGNFLFILAVFGMSIYFLFAAVQGNLGLFKRIQIEAEADALEEELFDLRQEVAAMENKTRRLSDDYLDLDLLDQQARDILGMVRPDEIIIN